MPREPHRSWLTLLAVRSEYGVVAEVGADAVLVAPQHGEPLRVPGDPPQLDALRAHLGRLVRVTIQVDDSTGESPRVVRLLEWSSLDPR